jgi:regulator of sigma E protease
MGAARDKGGGMNGALAIFNWSSAHIFPVVIGIVALGVVVFLHELGHFIVAKLRGIRVEVFSIGFPPKIWGFKKGGTEYRISLIFVGGYVKLAGMEFEEGVDPRSVKDGYYRSSIASRLAVCASGPLMNLLSAFLIYCAIYLHGFPSPVSLAGTVIGNVIENSPAERAGLKPGDRVLQINGAPIERWEEVTKSIVYSTLPAVEVTFERGGRRLSKRIVPERDEKLRLKRIGILPRDLISVDVVKGSAAEAAGVMDGDFIVGAEGEKIYSWEQLTKIIKSHDGTPVALELLREGKPVAVTAVPLRNPELGYPAIGIKLRLDVSMDDLAANGLVVYLHRNPFSQVAGNVREMYLTLKGLVSRALSPRGLAGPIAIVEIMSYSARAGLLQFLYVIAFISVNLAVLNLMPIPVLDGGHMLIALIEGARRRPLSVKAMTVVQNIFITIFIALMLFISANDIMRSWGERITRLVFGEKAAEPTPAPTKKP